MVGWSGQGRIPSKVRGLTGTKTEQLLLQQYHNQKRTFSDISELPLDSYKAKSDNIHVFFICRFACIVSATKKGIIKHCTYSTFFQLQFPVRTLSRELTRSYESRITSWHTLSASIISCMSIDLLSRNLIRSVKVFLSGKIFISMLFLSFFCDPLEHNRFLLAELGDQFPYWHSQWLVDSVLKTIGKVKSLRGETPPAQIQTIY